MDLVSILIPCYNAAPHLLQTIESALVQTWENKEIILLDDGSTDSSYEIARDYPIKVIPALSNQGQATTRNALFELSTGAYIQYLDADDYLLPDKITNQMKIYEENQDIDVVIDNFSILTKNGIYPHGHTDTILDTLALGCKYQSNCFLFRRRVLERIKWQDLPCQDSLMLLDLFKSDFNLKLTGYFSSVYRRDWSDTQITKQNLDSRALINEQIRQTAREMMEVEKYQQKNIESAITPWYMKDTPRQFTIYKP